MTSTDGMKPFEPAIRAATTAVETRTDEIRAAKESKPDDWQALRLRTFWNGDSALALAKPRRIKPKDVVVTADGVPQDYLSGHGVLAVLLRGAATHLVVDYTVDDAPEQIAIAISDL